MMGGFDVGWFHPGKNEQIKKQKRDVCRSWGRLVFLFFLMFISLLLQICVGKILAIWLNS